MKNCLSIEQSAELIKRGISADKASKMWVDSPEGGYNCEKNNLLLDALVWKKENDSNPVDFAPLFTLADLLSLMPKKIDDTYRLKIQSCAWPAWAVCYIDSQSGAIGWRQSMELIDALYELLLWAIDHNHVKLDLE